MNNITNQQEKSLNSSPTNELNISEQFFKDHAVAATIEKTVNLGKQDETYTLHFPLRKLAQCTASYSLENSILYENFKALCDNPNQEDSAQKVKYLLSGG